ncbi:hypothetical protein MAR_031654 [Mya arenaria]|uniref:Uncharacterized protein n=1 Tax=Mya arenaria TaxID=6604 RepID=A0ABY7F4F5_MYAAR|nr:hypothetical protein MAR_031654 [Mya arenaria]
MEVMCKVEKLYADFIWRQFTFSKGKKIRKKNTAPPSVHSVARQGHS